MEWILYRVLQPLEGALFFLWAMDSTWDLLTVLPMGTEGNMHQNQNDKLGRPFCLSGLAPGQLGPQLHEHSQSWGGADFPPVHNTTSRSGVVHEPPAV